MNGIKWFAKMMADYYIYIIKRFISRLKNHFQKKLDHLHFETLSNFKGNAVVSYIVRPLYNGNDFSSIISHQNFRETIEIVNILLDMGYNVDLFNFTCNNAELLQKFNKKSDLIIGFGFPYNFFINQVQNKESKKLFYSTGTYIDFQNKMIEERTKNANEHFHLNIKPIRIVKDVVKEEYFKSDGIIQIGSSFTLKTFPKEIRNKIYLIRQSTFEILFSSVYNKNYELGKRNFLWFGSYGGVLKGLDILLDYFSEHKELNLYIVGMPEFEFVKSFKKYLFGQSNIKYYGWLPITSNKLLEIASFCDFIIFPSASEGGMPGSVLNMMRLGLIPIVSEVAGFDEIDKFGFVIKMEELNKEGLKNKVVEVQRISSIELTKRARDGQKYVVENFNLCSFGRDFKSAIEFFTK